MENRFAENISNEEVAALPILAFGGDVVVVDSEERIAKACECLMASPVIGFDTETRPTFKPGALNKTALLQLSTRDCCYLFRLCKIPLDKRIIKVLENKNVVKVGADITNDLRALKELRHFTPAGFIDLQSIVPQWGIAEKSVRKMAGIILKIRVSKAQRLSNWEASKLTPAQMSYASTDAWVCLRMYDELNSVRSISLSDCEAVASPEKAKKKKTYKPWKRIAKAPGEAGDKK